MALKKGEKLINTVACSTYSIPFFNRSRELNSVTYRADRLMCHSPTTAYMLFYPQERACIGNNVFPTVLDSHNTEIGPE